MKAQFTFDEMVMNSVCTGRVIYYDDKQEVIDYIKVEKKSRQLIVHCASGLVFPCKQDDVFEFEVNNRKVWRKVNAPRLKGKDVWGTEEIER